MDAALPLAGSPSRLVSFLAKSIGFVTFFDGIKKKKKQTCTIHTLFPIQLGWPIHGQPLPLTSLS